MQSCEERADKAFKRLSAKKGNSPVDDQILEDVRKDYRKAVEASLSKVSST